MIQEKDIKHALSVCSLTQNFDKCKTCYYRECPDGCVDKLLKDALSVINRKDEELIRQKSMNQAKLDMIHDLRAELETVKIDTVNKFADELTSLYADDNITDDMHCSIGIIKANIKDVAQEIINK